MTASASARRHASCLVASAPAAATAADRWGCSALSAAALATLGAAAAAAAASACSSSSWLCLSCASAAARLCSLSRPPSAGRCVVGALGRAAVGAPTAVLARRRRWGRAQPGSGRRLAVAGLVLGRLVLAASCPAHRAGARACGPAQAGPSSMAGSWELGWELGWGLGQGQQQGQQQPRGRVCGEALKPLSCRWQGRHGACRPRSRRGQLQRSL